MPIRSIRSLPIRNLALLADLAAAAILGIRALSPATADDSPTEMHPMHTVELEHGTLASASTTRA